LTPRARLLAAVARFQTEVAAARAAAEEHGDRWTAWTAMLLEQSVASVAVDAEAERLRREGR